MVLNRINPLLLAACSSSAVAFFIGSQCSTKEWLQLVGIKSAYADSVVVAPHVPSIPSGPTTASAGLKMPPSLTVNEDELDAVWLKPSRASEIMRFGYPGFDNLRTYEDFVVSYDRRNRTAHWVMEHLSPERMAYNAEVDRSKSVFKEDETIHPYFRSKNEDYRRSGYDRGHLAAAANHRTTQLAMDQTFLLTNMSPQVGKGFNRDKWNDLERHVREVARKGSINTYVCTGPLYLPKMEADGALYIKYKVIGSSRVAVPTHFFKAVLFERTKDNFELEVYLMPNDSIPDEKPISDFLVNLDTVEIAAGLLIFDRLSKPLLKKVNGKSIAGAEEGLFGRIVGRITNN
uniref:Endonuclease n=1 Tax=Heterodera avenae TaxID=34510 RepID=A0A2L0VDL7_HETAV|nr:putative effector protein [Heterodera avenae]